MRKRRAGAAGIFLVVGVLLVWFAAPPTSIISARMAAKRWEAVGGIPTGNYEVVRQRFLWDCGYAALATYLATANEGETLYDSLRAAAPLRPGGASVQDLEYLGREFGRPLQGRYAGEFAWHVEPRPYLLLLSERHYVVVYPHDSLHVVIADPLVGAFVTPLESLVNLRPIAVLTPDTTRVSPVLNLRPRLPSEQKHSQAGDRYP